MKKIYFLLLAFCFGFSVNAQIITIPDANFKAKLLLADSSNTIATDFTDSSFKIDANNNGEIEISEANNVKGLLIQFASISDLTGINSFNNLVSLNCENNQIPSLDVSGLTNLTTLVCSYNQMTSLNVTGFTNLVNLDCSWNQITSLNVTGFTNLVNLDCSQNQILSLDVSGLTNLKWLNCFGNQIPSLNVTELTNLITLVCSGNQIPSLNVTGLTNLILLSCSGNQIPSLDVGGLTNLINLECSYNQIPSLNLSGLTHLQYLDCSNNQIPSLNLTGLTNLFFLDCSGNQMPSLNLSGLTNLQRLNCSNNQLTSIDVNGLTSLQWLNCSDNQITTLNLIAPLDRLNCSHNQLTSLNVSGLINLQELDCSYNQITSLDVSGFTILYLLNCSSNQLVSLFIKNSSNLIIFEFSNMPNLQYICADDFNVPLVQSAITQYGYTNCHVNSYCSFIPGGTFYTIQGNSTYDSNNNGCDASDIHFPSIKYTINDGTNTGSLIADTSGNYSIPVQAGTHNITPVIENPSYFIISPTTVSVTFPDVVSPAIRDFCFTANGVHNDLEVTIIPLNNARPGFDVNYTIVYKNKGNQIQSGTVNLTFNDSVLDLVAANPAANSQTLDNLNWSFSNLLPFESREILVTLNLNSPLETPPVNFGFVLNYTATITGTTDETPLDNLATLNQTVVNSFDPNDKTCLEGTTILPSQVGKEVHYMIRFENTGTANAENIVVKDMIDTTKFDVSTLIPIASSHSFVTRITETNKVEFIFENIQLPFDDANNDGYVAFKIKTKPTLVLGDTFSNTASIYFDYNFPIITDPAVTTVANPLANQDFEFENYISLYPIPAKNVLNIQSKNTIEISSISIYNTLGQLVQVFPSAKETTSIDVSSLTTGTYFIKVLSDKGTSNTKFVKE